MPQISLWSESHDNNYKFIDKQIKEMFAMGGVGILVHKLIGIDTKSEITGDATKPVYTNNSEQNIQDLLFLENRDRKYERDLYKLRGHYSLGDNTFNLSQIGMYLVPDTIYVTFHINDMIERMGRKLIAGDVLEMPNMKDYWPLNDDTPTSLRKFYVVNEILRAPEGYSQTWWPHLYKLKATPLVNSQEYKDILNQAADPKVKGKGSIADIMSPYLKNLQINQAIVDQAEAAVQKSGYNTEKFFVLPLDPNTSVSVQNHIVSNYTVDGNVATPSQNTLGYITGDNIPPNGFSVRSLTYFPDMPTVGEYVLRLDYLPNRLYRWDGTRWNVINEVIRNPMTGNVNQNQLGTFVNNSNKTRLNDGTIIDEKQELRKILSPKSDF